jgi:hypothetical protein
MTAARARLASRAPTRPYRETLGAVLDYLGATGGRGRAWPWRVRRLAAEIGAWQHLEWAVRKGGTADVAAAVARLDTLRGALGPEPERLAGVAGLLPGPEGGTP